jgi:flagellar hook assembly protein FlgD
VRQRVIPGNAADEIESERLSVTAAIGESLLYSPRISPNPFTPNGDGINDVAHVSFKLLRVTSAVPVALEVFDLSGRLVKQVYSGELLLGDYAHAWDGTDSSNSLVPPGLYLCRISVDLHSGNESGTGALSVAY